MMLKAKYNIPGKAKYEEIWWCDYHSDFNEIGFKSSNIFKQDGFGTFKSIKNDTPLTISIGEDRFILPFELKHIVQCIEESRGILKLEDDWNDLGALAIQFETWSNAMRFLINYSKYAFENFSVIISSPEINPCSDGGIDLVWRMSSKRARLLVNIKPVGSQIYASYYGDLYEDGQSIRNVIKDEAVVEYLAFWMKNIAK